MQNIFIEKPYQFVRPLKASWPQKLLAKLRLYQRTLRRREGVISCEIRNADRLSRSLADGHGIMITPNHPRPADPITIYNLIAEVGCSFYTMASWHLFNQGSFARFVIRLTGAFSVNREGMDRTAIDFAINALKNGERPLVIFPEGTTSRTNDRLMAFLDGPAFIARTAVKRRSKQGQGSGKVVVHPVAIKCLRRWTLIRAWLLDQVSYEPEVHFQLPAKVVKSA